MLRSCLRCAGEAYRYTFRRSRNRFCPCGDKREKLDINEERKETGNKVEGKVFVITGSLEHYENRNALKAAISREGGKVAGSVSGNTDYLITNDPESGSSKNRKARELGVSIITEEEIMEMLGQ